MARYTQRGAVSADCFVPVGHLFEGKILYILMVTFSATTPSTHHRRLNRLNTEREREGGGERETHRERQTDRQTETKTEKQRRRQTHRETDRQRHRHTETDRQTGRQAERQTDSTDRLMD